MPINCETLGIGYRNKLSVSQQVLTYSSRSRSSRRSSTSNTTALGGGRQKIRIKCAQPSMSYVRVHQLVAGRAYVRRMDPQQLDVRPSIRDTRNCESYPFVVYEPVYKKTRNNKMRDQESDPGTEAHKNCDFFLSLPRKERLLDSVLRSSFCCCRLLVYCKYEYVGRGEY